MLHVLRHYLPFKKALLIASETILLTLIVMAGMSSHLWGEQDQTMVRLMAYDRMSLTDARWVTVFSALIVSILAQITIAFNELYDFRVSTSRYDRAARFLGSAGTAIVLVLIAVGLMEMWGIERVLDFPGLPLSQTVVVLTASLLLGFTVLYFWRALFHGFLHRLNVNQRLLILGSGRLAQRLVDDLLGHPDSGYEIVGVLAGAGGAERRRRERRGGDRREERRGPSSTGNPWFEASTAGTPSGPGAAVLKTLESQRLEDSAVGVKRLLLAEDLSTATDPETAHAEEVHESIHELASRLDVDDIVVAFEERRGSLPTEQLLRCRLDGVVVTEAEAFYERLTGKIPAEAMRPSYLIFNRGFLQHPFALFAKRVLDISCALIGILLSWPLMIATAILVRLDSPGPILFRQERTGAQGQSFTLMKFRSMRQDAEKVTGPVWAQEDDPRITRSGKFIRKTRLDELPQLFNVLSGSMSMVGPRPERPNFVEDLTEKIPYYHQRHIVKPGITGWAQINYPYGNTLEDALQKLQYDLFYIKYQSLIFDLSILFNTVKTVLLRKGT